MKIPLSKMKCYYANIGERADGIGIANILKIPSLYNVYMTDIAKELRAFLKTNYEPIKAIRKYMKQGVSVMYSWPTIIVKPQKDFYYIIEGCHRILALILLKEKYLNVNRTIMYINRTPTEPIRKKNY